MKRKNYNRYMRDLFIEEQELKNKILLTHYKETLRKYNIE